MARSPSGMTVASSTRPGCPSRAFGSGSEGAVHSGPKGEDGPRSDPVDQRPSQIGRAERRGLKDNLLTGESGVVSHTRRPKRSDLRPQHVCCRIDVRRPRRHPAADVPHPADDIVDSHPDQCRREEFGIGDGRSYRCSRRQPTVLVGCGRTSVGEVDQQASQAVVLMAGAPAAGRALDQPFGDEPVEVRRCLSIGRGLGQVLGQAAVVRSHASGAAQQRLPLDKYGAHVGTRGVEQPGHLMRGQAIVPRTGKQAEHLAGQRRETWPAAKRVPVEAVQALGQRGAQIEPPLVGAAQSGGEIGVEKATVRGRGDGQELSLGQARAANQELSDVLGGGLAIIGQVEPGRAAKVVRDRSGPGGHQDAQAGGLPRAVANDQFCERRGPLGRTFVETVDNHKDVVEQAPRRRQHLERVVQGAIICGLGTRAVEHGVTRRGHRILADKRVVRQPQIARDRGVSGQAAGKLSGQTRENPDRIGRERSVRLTVVGRVDAQSPLRLPPGIDAQNQSGLSGAGAAGDEQHSFGCL